jgi:hypothetical protein
LVLKNFEREKGGPLVLKERRDIWEKNLKIALIIIGYSLNM